MHLAKPIECTISRMDHSVKYGLWVLMMCQCRFISCNKCATLAGTVDNGEGCACVGAGAIWKLYCPLNFAVSLKLL